MASLLGKAPLQHDRVADAMDAIFDEGFGLMDSFRVMIEYYHRRRMTYETDLLRAVAGLLKRLETQKNGRFH